MPKSTTPTFVHNFNITANRVVRTELNARFNAAQQLQNACLNSALERVNAMVLDSEFEVARKLSKKAYNFPKDSQEQKATNMEAGTLYKKLREKYWLQKYSLEPIAAKCRQAAPHIYQHIDSQSAKAIAARVMKTIDKYIKNYGKKNKKGKNLFKPHFKRFGTVNSIESLNHEQGILFDPETSRVTWNACRANVAAKNSALTFLVNYADKKSEDLYEHHALKHRIKFCRILRKKYGRNTVYVLQVCFEGAAYKRPKFIDQSQEKKARGIDVNSHTIAIASSTGATLHPLPIASDGAALLQAELSSIDRKLSRSRMLSNPDCFKVDSKQKGKRMTNFSNNYKKLLMRKASISRKLAAGRKTKQGELVNIILTDSSHIKIEKVWYKGWQKSRLGKAIGMHGHGALEQLLKRRCTELNIGFEYVDPWKTALSQYCHLCQCRTKKTRQGWHRHTCCAQDWDRDKYSALLVLYCSFDGKNWHIDDDSVQAALASNPESFQ
ncbi:zinc ribbon domain-containing protein [Shewanella sp. 10N.286.51.B2]|uniref:zinc ribbon domain-containing protein n=1 Tax=Shewanella sp. 10N.286.51.B2 TaxID=3229707 RepID=UPI00354F2FC1